MRLTLRVEQIKTTNNLCVFECWNLIYYNIYSCSSKTSSLQTITERRSLQHVLKLLTKSTALPILKRYSNKNKILSRI